MNKLRLYFLCLVERRFQEAFSCTYIEFSLLIKTNVENGGTDTVIAIETVLPADA